MSKLKKFVIIFVLLITAISPSFSCGGPSPESIALEAAQEWTAESTEYVTEKLADLAAGAIGGGIPGVTGLVSVVVEEIIEEVITDNIEWTYSVPEKTGTNTYKVMATSALNVELPFFGNYDLSVGFPLTADVVLEDITAWAIDLESFSAVGGGGTGATIDFDGWYVGTNVVTTADDGDTIKAKLELSNGVAGSYTMRIRRDISFSEDATVDSLTFAYDGASVTKELSFTPPYATDESSTNGYHVDLLKGSITVWTMESNYPPRLEVTAPVITSLSVDFENWYVDAVAVTTADETDTVTAKIDMSDGDPGTYTMRIRRDITMSSDATVGEVSFAYDGTSANKQLSFTPPYATSESDTKGYHVDLLQGTTTVWTMTDAYPPRLAVAPLSIIFDAWYVTGGAVTTANESDTVTAKLALSHGGPGQYTMRIRRDISWASDETVQQVTFDYFGGSLLKELSFTPPYATGESSTNGYHVDLYEASTELYVMDNDYPPRLTVNS
ncbi:hypothetical protein ACFLVR_03970 [Chloroflexota bacterium]